MKVVALAFADDILLLEDWDVDMPRTLHAAECFFRAKEMQVNPKKCVSISTVRGSTVTRSKPSLRLPASATSSGYYGHFSVPRPPVFFLRDAQTQSVQPVVIAQQSREGTAKALPEIWNSADIPNPQDGIMACRTLRRLRRSCSNDPMRLLHLSSHTGS